MKEGLREGRGKQAREDRLPTPAQPVPLNDFATFNDRITPESHSSESLVPSPAQVAESVSVDDSGVPDDHKTVSSFSP